MTLERRTAEWAPVTIGRTSGLCRETVTRDEPGLSDLPSTCSLLICAIGLNLLVLGGISIAGEFLLERAAAQPQNGPLADPANEGVYLYLHWVGRLLVCVSAAFLLACATASVFAIARNARLTIPRRRSLGAVPVSEACPSAHWFACVTLPSPRQADPRAPPS